MYQKAVRSKDSAKAAEAVRAYAAAAGMKDIAAAKQLLTSRFEQVQKYNVAKRAYEDAKADYDKKIDEIKRKNSARESAEKRKLEAAARLARKKEEAENVAVEEFRARFKALKGMIVGYRKAVRDALANVADIDGIDAAVKKVTDEYVGIVKPPTDTNETGIARPGKQVNSIGVLAALRVPLSAPQAINSILLRLPAVESGRTLETLLKNVAALPYVASDATLAARVAELASSQTRISTRVEKIADLLAEVRDSLLQQNLKKIQAVIQGTNLFDEDGTKIDSAAIKKLRVDLLAALGIDEALVNSAEAKAAARPAKNKDATVVRRYIETELLYAAVGEPTHVFDHSNPQTPLGLLVYLSKMANLAESATGKDKQTRDDSREIVNATFIAVKAAQDILATRVSKGLPLNGVHDSDHARILDTTRAYIDSYKQSMTKGVGTVEKSSDDAPTGDIADEASSDSMYASEDVMIERLDAQRAGTDSDDVLGYATNTPTTVAARKSFGNALLAWVTANPGRVKARSPEGAFNAFAGSSEALGLISRVMKTLDQQLLKALRAMKIETSIYAIPEAEWRALAEASGMPSDTLGVFVPASATGIAGAQDAIYVNEGLFSRRGSNTPDSDLAGRVLMHELVHAATAERIRIDSKLRTRIESLRDVVRRYVNAEGDGRGGDATPEITHALSNADEFVAATMVQPNFRALLARVPMTVADRLKAGLPPRPGSGFSRLSNVWRSFVEVLARAFALDKYYRNTDAADSALVAALEISSHALDPKAQVDLFLAQQDEASRPLAEVLASVGMMPAAVANIIESSKGNWKNLAAKSREVFLGLMTTTQISDVGKNLFKKDALLDFMYGKNSRFGGLEVTERAILAKGQIAQALTQEYAEEPQKIFARLKPQEVQPLSDVLMDSSLNEIHIDLPLDHPMNEHVAKGKTLAALQQRARYPALRKAYDALSPDAKKAYRELLDVFTKLHARYTSDIFRSIVLHAYFRDVSDYVDKLRAGVKPPPKPPTFMDSAEIQRIANILADKDAVSDPANTASIEFLGQEALSYAAEVRRHAFTKGPYVPFRRYGDFVISGKIEKGDGWHEFATLAEAEAFAKNTNMEVLEDEIGYYDSSGTRITKPDSAILSKHETNELKKLGTNPSPEDVRRAKAVAKRKAWAETIKQPGVVTRYRVRVQNQVVVYAKTKSEADAIYAELRNTLAEVTEVDRRRDPEGRASGLDTEIDRLIERVTKDPSLSPSDRIQLAEAMRNNLAQISTRAAVNSTFLKRRKVVGANRDLRISIADYGVAAANYIAATETVLDIRVGLKSMRDATEDARVTLSRGDADTPERARGDTIKRREILREIEMRTEQPGADLGGRGGTNPILRNLLSLTFINYLLSASYSIVNATQPYAVSLPYLSARHGWIASTAAMVKANRDINAGAILGMGLKDTVAAAKAVITRTARDTPNMVEFALNNIRKGENGANRAAMIEYLIKFGKIDRGAGLELTQAFRPNATKITRGIARVESLARALPSSIEVINRMVASLAAYDLEFKKTGDHEAAVAYAYKVTDTTQFDYSSANTARYMDARRYPLLAPAMTFRKFSQGMYFNMGRSVYMSLKGATKQERQEGFRQFRNLMLTHAFFGGALGLATEPIHVMLGVLSLALGEDEPWDWETGVMNALTDAFGPDMAQILGRGLPRYLGVDTASRISLDGLIFMKDMRDYDPQTISGYMGDLVFGAPGSMIGQALGAFRHLGDGNYRRALEAILPKQFRDALKATRISDEGITTRRGNRIDGNIDLSIGEAITQTVGFTPGRISRAYETRDQVEGANRRMTKERSELIRRWNQAEPGAARDAVRAEITRWNERLPPELNNHQNRITYATLMRSQQERRRQERQGQGWGALPRGREAFRQEGRSNPDYPFTNPGNN
jgi:hypothetical protein